MPRRFVETEMRYNLKTGCLRCPVPPPRPIIVTPDPLPIRCCRDIKCAWYLAVRRVSAWKRKAGKLLGNELTK